MCAAVPSPFDFDPLSAYFYTVSDKVIISGRPTVNGRFIVCVSKIQRSLHNV